MQDMITKAVGNFFKDTLGFDYKDSDIFLASDVYVSSVFLQKDGKRDNFYLAVGDDLIKEISKVMFFEDEPDSETKIDLVGECANLIIGNLKVLLSDKEDIELGTPEYQGFFDGNFSKEFDDSYYFNIENHDVMVGVESVKSGVLV